MKRIKNAPALILLCSALLAPSCRQTAQKEEQLISFVRPLNGTDGRGFITPVVVAPFGMMQLGPDTRRSASGYSYSDSSIIGFSHTHKSGGGCNDFQDILLQPFTGEAHFEQGSAADPSSGYRSRFSHDREEATVGMYSVILEDYDIEVALTATRRCGMHRYRYPEGQEPGLVLDLEHGSDYGCTIIKEDNYDTVKTSSLHLLSHTRLEGSRISSGMTEEMHVYFAMEFNRPFSAVKVRDGGRIDTLNKEFRGTDIRAIFRFENPDGPLLVRVGISNVSTEGAWGNLQSEIRDWNFDGIVDRNRSAWEKQLQKVRTEGGTEDQKIIFYTGLYHVFTYPMLYSDTDGRFRGPDHKVHLARGYDNYSGVVGVWDTYRSAVPLLHFTNPKVSSDYINTMLDHYDIFGLLPIWTLWGNEFFGMLGYHCLPVIADAYSKGIGGFDPERALEAMQATAEKDTFGYWMRRWIGLKNYKDYGYVPADLEYTSVSKTLEYAYDDWCLSCMAGMLNEDEVARKYLERSRAYRHVYDPSTGFMRGKILAENNSRENKYVQELYLNGKPYRQSMILHEDLLNAELRFVMGPEPADWFKL